MHINKRWLEKKAARQERAAKNTAWNRYSIHDHETVKQRLAVQHKAKQAVAAKLGHPVPTGHDFIQAIIQNERFRMRFVGATSKYVPHQDARNDECARRRRQAIPAWQRQPHGL